MYLQVHCLLNGLKGTTETGTRASKASWTTAATRSKTRLGAKELPQDRTRHLFLLRDGVKARTAESDHRHVNMQPSGDQLT